MSSNFPLKTSSKKSFNRKQERNNQKFLVSTFSFALTLLVGFGAVFALTRQPEIAKAFIPPQPLVSADQFTKSNCYNQFDRSFVMPGDTVYCDFELGVGSADLNTTDYKYFGTLALGDEKGTNELINGDECEYDNGKRVLSCNSISTKGLNSGDKRKVFVAVKDVSKNEVKLVDSKLEISVR
jgi:hypothetical protein